MTVTIKAYYGGSHLRRPLLTYSVNTLRDFIGFTRTIIEDGEADLVAIFDGSECKGMWRVDVDAIVDNGGLTLHKGTVVVPYVLERPSTDGPWARFLRIVS